MNSSIELPFNKTFLYFDTKIKNVDPTNLKEYLEEKTGREVILRENFFDSKYSQDLPKKVAKTKVRNKSKREFKEPLPKEVELEGKIIKNKKDLIGILYDAQKLVKVMRDFLDDEEKKNHTVVLTKRLIGSKEKNEARYHARTVINSVPSIVSTSGIVEGPAKPRKYYFADEDEKEEILDFDPMKHSDDRMEEAIKSYLLQTIFWRLEGQPFCEEDGCPLVNSHWQKDVLQNQIEGELCERHRKKLETFKKNP